MRIPEQKIEEIKNSADIVDIISEYVQLKKRGKNFVGLCPFHREKTPSFTVSIDKQIYHCFGCHIGGNVFSFLMEYKKISFVEAVQELAEHLGVKLDFDESYSKNQSEQEILFDINTEVARYYSNNLLNELEAEYARSYLEKRNIKIQTIRAFGLGFALNKWDSLVKFLIGKNIDIDKALHLGLIGKTNNGKLYDKLAGRLIFPIFSPNGRVVAFAGRTLTEESDTPKYINSPESLIYVKGRVLYGLSFAKDEIRKLNNVILVEGYMDLISLYQNGIKNVVAISGTALTDEQAQLLSRYTRNIILLFDSDTSGINASLRSIEILLKRDCDVKIASLPSSEDPDSFINKYGKEKFTKIIKQADNFLEFHTAYLEKQGAFKDPQKTVEAIRELIKPVAIIEDELKRTILIKNISKKFNLREKLLENELDKLIKDKSKLSVKTQQKSEDLNKDSDLFDLKFYHPKNSILINKEVEIIKLLFEGDKNILEIIFSNIEPETFELEINKKIFLRVKDEFENFGNCHPSHLISLFDEETQKYLRQITLQNFTISDHWEGKYPTENYDKIIFDYTKDLIIKLKQLIIDKQISDKQKLIKSSNDESIILSLIREINELSKKKLNISLELPQNNP